MLEISSCYFPCSIWDVEHSQRVSHWNNNNTGSSCISSLAVLNPSSPSAPPTNTYVATGCDDGTVRVWRGAFLQSPRESSLPEHEHPTLLTAFQPTTDVNPATRSKSAQDKAGTGQNYGTFPSFYFIFSVFCSNQRLMFKIKLRC